MPGFQHHRLSPKRKIRRRHDRRRRTKLRFPRPTLMKKRRRRLIVAGQTSASGRDRRRVAKERAPTIKEVLFMIEQLAGADGNGRSEAIAYSVEIFAKHPTVFCRLLGRVLDDELAAESPVPDVDQ